MLDHDNIRRHHAEFAYLTGRFVVEHLVRLRAAFDGDVPAAMVLGSIALHNLRRFYEDVVPASGETMAALLARGAHRAYLRPCNAMSVSASTGIPRETVRRKIKWLAGKGWVVQHGRDKLFVTEDAYRHFVDFDIETVDRFYAAALRVLIALQQRNGLDGASTAPAARGTALVGAAGTLRR